MAVNRLAAAFVSNPRRPEVFGLALAIGAAAKISAVPLWGPVAGTIWVIGLASLIAIGRPALNRGLAVGLGPAILIAVAVSALLVPPLENAGCIFLSGVGLVVALAAWAIGRKGPDRSRIE
jgi:hypothetical protein